MSKKIKIRRSNKYAELIKEIDSDDLIEGLLGYGLFPDKIPPFLTSTSFYNWYSSNARPTFERTGKDYVRYENIRHINVPRLLAIPNPFAYANLCSSIHSYWNEIRKKIIENVGNQNFKVSRIHLRKMTEKKQLFEMNYNNYDKDGNPEQKIIIGKKFCVEADISNCFPSIYSHSLPWALVGKPIAKNNKDDNSKWYNKLDLEVRNVKNGETNGILIGPHSSNLLSEIILTKVDSVLCEKGYEYVRHIDDYKCFVDSFEKAEEFLLDLTTELKNFELFLNSKKTTIKSLPQASIKEWVNVISSFDLGRPSNDSRKVVLDMKRLKALIDTAIELMIKENNSAVINYTFKIISKKELKRHTYRYYIDSVHHLLLLYPYLTTIIDETVFKAFNVETIKIKKISSDLYDVGMEKRNYEACSYSVYWALKYGFKLDKNIINNSLYSNDCIFLTLGYLYSKRYMSKPSLKIYRDKAKKLAKSDFDRYWIFNYTVLPQPELSGDYKRIKKAKVTFIKTEFE